MKRRTVLGSLGTLSTGCFGRGYRQTGEQRVVRKEVRVEEVTGFDVHTPLTPDVTAVDPYISDQSTATLRVTMWNESLSPVELCNGKRELLPAVRSDGDKPNIGLPAKPVPPHGHAGTWSDLDATDGCWRIAHLESYRSPLICTRFDPLESKSLEVTVWGLLAADECVPTGEFTFESRHTIGEDRKEVSWSFRISVSRLGETSNVD